MRGAKITLPNQKRFALVPRSGSYSIIWQAIPESDRNPTREGWHPINTTTNSIGSPLLENEDPNGLCCMVRDPVERFRSACARKKVSIAEGLNLVNQDVHFWTLEFMGLLTEGVTYFRFPDQIQDCLTWLGIESTATNLNDEPVKPEITDTQRDQIIAAYSSDYNLWQSLIGTN